MLATRTSGKFCLSRLARTNTDHRFSPEYTKDPRIKEVVTLTSDLSRKNLEKDFERMDTPQGTFYRVYFDIYLTLDGSEFNAELVCQGEVMGRCTARFR
jgi:hypothetical protein